MAVYRKNQVVPPQFANGTQYQWHPVTDSGPGANPPKPETGIPGSPAPGTPGTAQPPMSDLQKADPSMYDFRQQMVDNLKKQLGIFSGMPDVTQQQLTPGYSLNRMPSVPTFSTANITGRPVNTPTVQYNKPNTPSVEGISPQNIQQINQNATAEGNPLLNKSADRASQFLDYQRDPNGNYNNYSNRNISSIMDILNRQQGDTARQQANQFARTGLGNSGVAGRTAMLTGEQFGQDKAKAVNDILNQAESWKREDIAANEANRQAAINMANSTAGQQFNQGMQTQDWNRQGQLANNAQNMELAKFLAQNRMFDTGTALSQADKQLSADQLNAQLGLETGKFNAGQDVAVQQANLEANRQNQQADFENQFRLAGYNDAQARQMALDKVNALMAARQDNTSRAKTALDSILNALNIGARGVNEAYSGQVANANSITQRAAAQAAADQANQNAQNQSDQSFWNTIFDVGKVALPFFF